MMVVLLIKLTSYLHQDGSFLVEKRGVVESVPGRSNFLELFPRKHVRVSLPGIERKRVKLASKAARWDHHHSNQHTVVSSLVVEVMDVLTRP